MSMVSLVKDRALSALLRPVFNRSPLAQLGEMTALRIDTENKEILLTLNLLGEQTPVEARLKYRVERGPQSKIIIEDAQFSREWMTKAFSAWGAGKMTFPIPDNALPLLDLLRLG